MPGEVNCIVTKVLIPFLEREAGPEAGAAICQAAGRSREWLTADHNWISLALANELMRLARERMGETDEEAWTRRFWEFGMDWKPREERSYLGTYTMGIGDPRTLYARQDVFNRLAHRWCDLQVVEIGRTRARFRRTPLPGYTMPRWACMWMKVTLERYPTNWQLPRALVSETQCAADGADACMLEVRWQNPSLGPWFWVPTLAGVAGAAILWTALQAAGSLPWPGQAGLALLHAAAGLGIGYGLRERQRRQHTQRLLDLQGEEIIYSNNELEKKFRELETKIEQLSLLIELSAAVNATLDPEKIYEQGLGRLVHGMRYQAVYFFTVDRRRSLVRGHQVAASDPRADVVPARLEFPLDAEHSVVGKVAITGVPIVVNDVTTTHEPIHRATAAEFGHRAQLVIPFRVRHEVVGVLAVTSWDAEFGESDIELVTAVADHVALAIDRAESFRTVEQLSRSLEDKVRVRTDELRTANEALQDKNVQLTETLEQQTATAEILRVMSSSPTDVQPVFDVIAASATRLCDGMFGVVFRFDGTLITMAAHHAFSPEALTAIQRGYPARPGRSTIAATAILERRILHIRDAQSGEDYPHPERARAIGYRSILSVPMMRGEAAIGAINVARREPTSFTEKQIALLQTFADQAVIAIENVRLFTELQAAYQDLKSTQMQLIQREKMASVGQLVAGVAHELNNPIGFVSSNVTTLEEFVTRLRAMLEIYRGVPLAPPDKARVDQQWTSLKVDYALKYLDSMILGIREGAERTRKIVRDLRVFARSDDDLWQPVDLHEEIESSLTLLNHLLKDRVVVHRHYGDLPSVECVRSQIDQVFLNLLANAAQAIAGQGEIRIETRQDDGTAVVTIADSGPGIAPEILGRIFDPFFTTKPVGEGTGLGLSISYEIVKKHRGTVTAASPPGGGAVFTVRLPLTRAA
jgi:signal transduction histidine kinase